MACKCVTCAECNGSGQVMESQIGYPEEDLETCSNCDGYGRSEICEECLDEEDEF